MTQPEPLTEQQLDDIEARAAGMFAHADLGNDDDQREAERLSGQDVPALLAEIRRLNALVAESEGDVALLRALKAFGVDNWDGYDEAIQSTEA